MDFISTGKRGKTGKNRKSRFDYAIDEIKSEQVFSGIEEQLGTLVETPSDLDTFTDGVMVAFLDKAFRDKAFRDNNPPVFDSPKQTTNLIINNSKHTNTNTKIETVSKGMNMEASQLIDAVKELTGTPVCKRTKNTLNDRIVKFLKKHGIEVDQSILRKALTRSVGDAQQMTDMWGKHVTNYAKSGDATCYLCGKKIYPFASCPEMEHKLPVTTAYSSMTHYRRLDGYHGNHYKKDDKHVTMYDLWKVFVNDADNAPALENLYKLINEQEKYDKEVVDILYRRIFNEFWSSTKYSEFNVNTHTEILYNFFYYFIKGWLLEFAYSHHTCNQSKSDFYIYNSMQQFNKMKTGTKKRQLQRTDAKVNVEVRLMKGVTDHQKAIIDRRDKMGLPMYNDFIETIDEYYNHYKQVNNMVGTAQGLTYLIEDGDTIEERLMMIKALYLVIDVKSKSNKEETSGKKQGDPSSEIKKTIDTKYKELLTIETEIFEKEAYYKRVQMSERIKNQTKGEISQLREQLQQLKKDLNELKPKLDENVENLKQLIQGYEEENYGEHPITCNFDCVASEETTSSQADPYVSQFEQATTSAKRYDGVVNAQDENTLFQSPEPYRGKISPGVPGLPKSKQRSANIRVEGEALFSDIRQFQPNNSNRLKPINKNRVTKKNKRESTNEYSKRSIYSKRLKPIETETNELQVEGKRVQPTKKKRVTKRKK